MMMVSQATETSPADPTKLAQHEASASLGRIPWLCPSERSGIEDLVAQLHLPLVADTKDVEQHRRAWREGLHGKHPTQLGARLAHAAGLARVAHAAEGRTQHADGRASGSGGAGQSARAAGPEV
eukprot:6181562-Pleurochrysis_carterae.AAC.4